MYFLPFDHFSPQIHANWLFDLIDLKSVVGRSLGQNSSVSGRCHLFGHFLRFRADSCVSLFGTEDSAMAMRPGALPRAFAV